MAESKKLNKSFSFSIKFAACFGVCWLMIIPTSTQVTYQSLQPGQVLRDGDSLESDYGYYKLRFLSTSNSSNNIYLGILYDDGIGEKQIVWVANRENPLTDHSGVLSLTSDGTLMINSTNDLPTVLYSGYRGASNLSLGLRIKGNLVLTNEKDEVIWQSIDDPTDTWLPDMKLGIFNLKSAQPREQSLVSWLTPSLATSGPFSFGVDPNNTKQLVISQRGSIVWESGVWNGTAFSHLPPHLFDINLREYDIAPALSFSYISNENESYFTFALPIVMSMAPVPIEIINRAFITVNSSGALDIFALSNNDNSTISNRYSCPDKTRSDWSTGCAVKRSNCPNGDNFVVSTNFTGRFDESNPNDSIGIYDCKEMCSQNCTCVAYSSRNRDGTGCLFSYVPSVGNLLLTNGSIYTRQIRQKNETQPYEKKGAGTSLLVIVCVPLVCFVLIIVFLQIYIFQRLELDENGGGYDGLLVYVGNVLRVVSDKFWNLRHPELVLEEQNSDLPFFSFYDMRYATRNFSVENKLGQGGFGPVYKGKLENGQEIAVKRLSKSSRQGIKEFKNEVILISKLQHRNLVKLLGCCIYRREKLLVYEYMPNNSLDSFIFDPTKRVLLDWGKRFSIIQGIAQGLLYLHKYSRLRIIHRDLKTSNVLLDNDLTPKISDFGTARIFGDDECSANTLRIVGTYGYMSPEYAMDGLFSEKSDVFSYGVMMLEIISGKKNTGFYHCDHFVNLLGYAWELWKEGNGLELMDAEIKETSSTNEVMRCIQIGLLCVQESAEDRPTMLTVMSLLSHESIIVPIPKQPAFFLNANASAGQPREDSAMCSVNNVTISDLNGR